jgi:hypothetical protein
MVSPCDARQKCFVFKSVRLGLKLHQGGSAGLIIDNARKKLKYRSAFLVFLLGIFLELKYTHFTEFDLDCQNCTLSSAILIRKSE